MDTQAQYIISLTMVAVVSFIFFKKKKNQKKVMEFMYKNAQIIDVRSKEEFSNGCNPRSVNIPLDKLENEIEKHDKTKPIIVCCASGMRSAMALEILKRQGFTEVINAGAWTKTL